MNIAKAEFEQNAIDDAKIKSADNKALWSLILGIAAWPLIFTGVGWLPAMIAAIVLGIMALKTKTEKRRMAVAGIVISSSIIIFTIIGFLFM